MGGSCDLLGSPVMTRVITALAVLALLATACSEPTNATITVLQLNICHGGMAGCYRGDTVLTKAAEVISAHKPQVLSVNEACENDVERLRPAMGPARALFVAARNLDGTPTRCQDGVQRYGNIIMVTDTLAGATEETGTYEAQNRSEDGHLELRSWACLPAGKVSACTTHLSSDSDQVALAQCQDLMKRAATYPPPTMIAGDFNLNEQGSPRIQDCDPRGFTRHHDGGVQHIYTSADLTPTTHSTIDMAGTTDHPGLLLTVTPPD